ncbi:hypothetical protein H8E77_15525 [bacterium]|nr:hypothetical protein [bacterium]
MKVKFLPILTVGVLAITLSVSPVQAARLFAITGAGGTESIVYELDPTTGATIREVGHTGFHGVFQGESQFSSLAFNPVTGTAYAHANDYYSYNDGVLCTIDMDTGEATEVTGLGTQARVPDMTFNSSGTCYAWIEDGFTWDDLLTFDLVTGEPTLVGESDIGTWGTGLACDSSDNLYVKTGEAIYSVNRLTGVATNPVYLSGATHNALAFDEDDTLYSIYRVYGDSVTTYLVTIDIGTGLVTTVGDIGLPYISAIAFLPGPSHPTIIDIDPDTLNLKSKGKWVTCYIELPDGYNVGDVDVDSILLESSIEIQNSDVQNDVLMVKFDRQEVILYIELLLEELEIIPPTDVTLTVTGEVAGTPFEGSGTIRVINKGK